MTPVALSFGGNLGEPVETIQKAIEYLRRKGILHQLIVSSFYRTAPWGGASGDEYINAVVVGNTSFTPDQILVVTQRLETRAGRVRTGEQYAPRPLDIDILTFGWLIVESDSLTLPHPRLRERRFVLEPFCEIAPEWAIPPDMVSVKTLVQHCDDPLPVVKWNG
ncbi:MAG: 2-amino-4-hydroxy-6-hydroxymethyldihydropteridine diphosphokinase [bacterium]|nr:2-amino-4-hydroxy-6-hydroxymethyldihydropteridine diphosphokinase [bacterium]